MAENAAKQRLNFKRVIAISSLCLSFSVTQAASENQIVVQDIGSHLNRLTASQIDSQLHLQRQFVEQEIQQAQTILQSLLEANLAPPASGAQEQYRAVMSERVADYAKAQKEIFEAYTDFLRLRQTMIFDFFAEEVDATTWSFARTGYVAPPPVLVEFEPLPVSSLELGTQPYFPGLPSRASGFFGQMANTP
jgi:hypothetical protein